MKYVQKYSVVAFWLAVTTTSQAQRSEQSQHVTTGLASFVGEVLETNSALRAARLHWESKKEFPEIARSLDDPKLTYGHFFRNVETRVGPMNQQVAVSQKFPFPGKRSLAASKAEKDALIAMWQFQTLERELIRKSKEVYYDLHLVEVSSRILNEEVSILQTMLTTAKARYESGAGEQQEVLKVQLTTKDIERRLLGLKKRHETALARMNALRNSPPTTPLYVTPPLLPDKLPTQKAAFRLAEEYRQELSAAGVVIARDEVDVALARKNWWPDFNVGVQYSEVGSSVFSRPPDDGQDAVMGVVSINIPIWWGKLKAQKREAQKRLEASRELELNVESEVQSQVRDSWYRAHIAFDQMELYQNGLIPTAEQSFSSARAGYQAAKVGFLDVLDSQRALLNLRLGLAVTESELGKALAQLERSIGVDIEIVQEVSTSDERAETTER